MKPCVCGKMYSHSSSLSRHRSECTAYQTYIAEREKDNVALAKAHYYSKNLDYDCGYLYLLREREFLLSGQDTYKFGMTIQKPHTHIARLKKYKKGSEVILVIRVAPHLTCLLEKQVLTTFRNNFVSHPDGTEYFTGDPDAMVNIILSTVRRKSDPEALPQAKTSLPHNDSSNTFSNVGAYCICGSRYKHSSSLSRHKSTCPEFQSFKNRHDTRTNVDKDDATGHALTPAPHNEP